MPTLYEQMGRLGKSVDANTAVTEKLDGRFRKWRRLTVVAAAVAVFAVYAAVTARQAVDEANQRADARSFAACAQFNVQRAEIRQAFKDSLGGLVQGRPLTPAEVQIVAIYSATVDERLPFRDCSPSGLAAYYANPPVDPATR